MCTLTAAQDKGGVGTPHDLTAPGHYATRPPHFARHTLPLKNTHALAPAIQATLLDGGAPGVEGQEEAEVGVRPHHARPAGTGAALVEVQLAARLQQGVEPVQDGGVAQVGVVQQHPPPRLDRPVGLVSKWMGGSGRRCRGGSDEQRRMQVDKMPAGAAAGLCGQPPGCVQEGRERLSGMWAQLVTTGRGKASQPF